MTMQKLVKRRITNTPKSTSLAPSSVALSLNKEETLSEQSLKTLTNNLEVNNSNIQEVVKTYVYVLSCDGKPLMPCSRAKARKMLRKGEAKIVGYIPFTIQLNFECKNQVQDIILGVDTGYENIGLSAVSEKAEYWSSEVKLRNNVSKLLAEKKMYRRLKRKKLWYRKPRFLNRKKEKGWLAPSIRHRLDSHIRLVDKIYSLLPIIKINVETANFDIQKINIPSIEGVGYQQGNLYEYENMKSYLITRENGKCQLCGKESTRGNSFRLHHIISRVDGGTDKVNNMALLHEKCHEELHKKNLKHLLKKNKQFKSETFMSSMKNELIRQLRNKYNNVIITFGYITKILRHSLKLEKSHSNDAFVIANGNIQSRTNLFNMIQKRHNNRCLQLNRKGFKPSIRRQRYKYQPKDIVVINDIKYDVVGIRGKGKYIVVKKDNIKMEFSIKKIEKYYFINSWKII